MTPRASLATLFAGAATAVALGGVATAQTFPADGAYTALPCGDGPMTDPFQDESGALDERDLVGDGGNPAGLRALDTGFLYLRMRVDNDAIPGGVVRPFAWGMEIDTDGDFTTYELLGLVDGVSGNVLLYTNNTTTVANDPTDPADTPAVASFPITSHARSTTASGTSYGGDGDFFLSFALPWSMLSSLGLDPDTPVMVWAASSSSANALNGDFACHDGTTGDPSLTGVDNERTVLDPAVDSDGDGYSDATEVEAGSDPNDPDSVPGAGGGELAFAGGGGCAIGDGAGAGTSAAASALFLAGLALGLARLARVRRRTHARADADPQPVRPPLR
jgi:hypothetical protein